jgi:hypothetical protein
MTSHGWKNPDLQGQAPHEQKLLATLEVVARTDLRLSTGKAHETYPKKAMIRSAFLEVSPEVTNYGHTEGSFGAIIGFCHFRLRRLPGHQRLLFPEPLVLPN